MAYNDNALVLVPRGAILLGAVGAAAPTTTNVTAFVSSDGSTVPTGFTDIGHVSVDGISFPNDISGGEALATFRSDVAATTAIVSVDSITFVPQQVDGVTLPLYYGGGTVTAGKFAKPRTRAVQERAALIVFFGGTNLVWAYAPRVGVAPSDAISVAPGDFATLPLTATILTPTGTASPLEWNSSAIAVPA